MLEALKRDWRQLIIILLVCGGLEVLTNAVAYKGVAVELHLTEIMIFVFAIVTCLFQQVLPACIHEQKKLWSIGWKYLAFIVLCEILLFVLVDMEVSYSLLKWPYFVTVNTLFLGFLCAAANATGLWVGIKKLFTKHLLVWLIGLIAIKLALLLGLMWAKMSFLRGVWVAAIYILVVYACLPLLKQKAN